MSEQFGIKSHGTQYVYFLLDEESDAVKIGHSASDVAARITNHQIGNPRPLRLLGVMPGDVRFEHELHRRFLLHLIRGEWFKYSGAVKEYLDAAGLVDCSRDEGETVPVVGPPPVSSRRLGVELCVRVVGGYDEGDRRRRTWSCSCDQLNERVTKACNGPHGMSLIEAMTTALLLYCEDPEVGSVRFFVSGFNPDAARIVSSVVNTKQPWRWRARGWKGLGGGPVMYHEQWEAYIRAVEMLRCEVRADVVDLQAWAL